MRRSGPPVRRTPLRAASVLARTRSGKSKMPAGIPLKIRREVWARSGGFCECGCKQIADHIHHRKLRSQGGQHELPNLLHLTTHCHEAVHRAGDRAYDLGYLVRSWQNPDDIPVQRGLL